jgi:hypothetical protein
MDYTTEYGSQIGSFADYYLIHAQTLQGDGVKIYSDYVHRTISKLKFANPDLVLMSKYLHSKMMHQGCLH